MTQRAADLSLLAVACLWGISFPLIKLAMSGMSPLLFVGTRFVLGFALVVPLVWRAARFSGAAVRAGAWLGLLASASYATQTAGLQYTTATKSGFITGLNVVLVPWIVRLLGGRPLGALAWSASLVSFGGIALMSLPEDAAPGALLAGFNRGDALTLACAVLYALYMVLLSRALAAHPFQTLLLAQIATIAVSCLALSPVLETPRFAATGPVLAGLAGTALFSTAGALYLQNRAQAHTTPTRAALLFATEPVFAAGFAALLLGERMPAHAWIGAALILGAIVVTELRAASA